MKAGSTKNLRPSSGELLDLFLQRNYRQETVDLLFGHLLELRICCTKIIETPPSTFSIRLDSLDKSASSLIRNFKDISLEDLHKFEVVSVRGSDIIFKKRISATSKLNLPKTALPPKTPSFIPQPISARSFKSEVEPYEAEVMFKNQAFYKGIIHHKLAEGPGKYIYNDGTVYEGNFIAGFPTGLGKMVLPDLTRYEGEFYKGLFHGDGTLFVSASPVIYSGGWKYGLKHGKGWVFYGPNDWYDGEWCDDKRHGFGFRNHPNGTKYHGQYFENKRNGKGTMIWTNGDYYDGDWVQNQMTGYGEYVWKAFFNKTFTFPLLNTFWGYWCNNKRDGIGIMNYGTVSGAKLAGYWKDDKKNGEFVMFAGNGRFLEGDPLFLDDKPTNFINLTKKPSVDELTKRVHQNGPILLEKNPENRVNNDELLNMSVFTIAEDVDLRFYINLILDKTINTLYQIKGHPDDYEGFLDEMKEFERITLRNTLIQFMPQLSALYKKYANVATDTQPDYETVMIRLFIWQFYRDIDICNRMHISLYDMDAFLAKNPYCGNETIYDPFECFYFWQFIMSLVSTTVLVIPSEQFVENDERIGVLAAMFKFFLNKYVFNQTIAHKGGALFEYKNLMPIKKVYKFYQSLGEPLRVREFLDLFCWKKREHLPCYYGLNRNRKKVNLLSGINAVLVGHNIAFLDRLPPNLGEKVDDPLLPADRTGFAAFHKLGPRKTLRHLAKICPNVIIDGFICNVEYPMVFLEFYETLISCASSVATKELKRLKMEELLEMKKRDEIMIEENDQYND